jgi:hypothetical protein
MLSTPPSEFERCADSMRRPVHPFLFLTKVGTLSRVNDAHPAATQSLYDPIVRDGAPDHWRESYVSEISKPMKAGDLTVGSTGWLAKYRHSTH